MSRWNCAADFTTDGFGFGVVLKNRGVIHHRLQILARPV